MNDYEMMNQRVDELRECLREADRGILEIQKYKTEVMEELLDTRRQITQADRQAKLVLGSR